MVSHNILTVSQINFYVKSLLDGDAILSNVFISGEISNFTDHYRSGHLYMSLKDSGSIIRAVMFAGNASRLRFRPMDGMKVIVRGRISLYESTGQYQLYIDDMQPDGIGALSLAFEQLKQKMQKLGYFDASHKKAIPPYPETIAIITSPTGAAIEDLKNIIHRRSPSTNILMCPVLVQGEQAPLQLMNAIKAVDRLAIADVIIIGRGGGSAEDLWPFNDEELAKAIYDCTTPIISAVGHETDFTICDFVADLRAPTPSAAAELAVADKSELNKQLEYKKSVINSLVQSRIHESSNAVNLLFKEYDLKYHSIISNLDTTTFDIMKNRLSDIINLRLNNDINIIQNQRKRLSALDPVHILKRGFAHLSKDGETISSALELSPDECIDLIMSDGKVKAKVVSIDA